jgi:hypothetical protein
MPAPDRSLKHARESFLMRRYTPTTVKLQYNIREKCIHQDKMPIAAGVSVHRPFSA